MLNQFLDNPSSFPMDLTTQQVSQLNGQMADSFEMGLRSQNEDNQYNFERSQVTQSQEVHNNENIGNMGIQISQVGFYEGWNEMDMDAREDLLKNKIYPEYRRLEGLYGRFGAKNEEGMRQENKKLMDQFYARTGFEEVIQTQEGRIGNQYQQDEIDVIGVYRKRTYKGLQSNLL